MLLREAKMEVRRVLVLCAHDDDEVIGPGATIRKLANAGVEVTTLVCATGNEGYSRIEDRDTIVGRRGAERENAARIIGTSRTLALDFHDYDHLDNERVYREIIRAVRHARPHLVLTHAVGDYLAHRTLATVAPEAVWQAGWQSSLELGEPWRIQRIYRFPVLEFMAKPSHVVDITDTLTAKLDAMRAYASQLDVVSGILDMIESRARAYGSLVGVRYAEAFERCGYIPVRVDDPRVLVDSLV
jgi:LmbE family N-acetylglucosaminyl deacetylase